MTERLSAVERRKQQTRQEILDAALDCFAEKGYHAAGIGDIAERVGIAHGTFYRYFDSKRDIVEQVLDDLMTRIAVALADVPPEAPTTLEGYQEQADRIATSLTKVLTEDAPAARFLLLQAAAVDAEMAQKVLAFYDAGDAINSAYLQHGVDAGYFRQDLDVAAASRAVNGMLFAAAMYGLGDRTEAEKETLAVTIRQIIYFGLTGPR